MRSLTEDERLVPMRLQRFLARAGVASRRGSEGLMTAGRVTVNGEVKTEMGTKIDPLVDRVEVDGRPVSLIAGATYLVLNKPSGYVTTMSDPQGRPCIADLVPTDRYPSLYPVGRLDKDTTGFLLFTTDGDLGQALLHPSHHVDKTYIALVDGILRDTELEPLRHGITLDDGPCQPAICRILSQTKEPSQAYAFCNSSPGDQPPSLDLWAAQPQSCRPRLLEAARPRRNRPSSTCCKTLTNLIERPLGNYHDYRNRRTRRIGQIDHRQPHRRSIEVR